VNVALVTKIGEVATKSSADSISSLPAEPGREAVAILPSGFPVLKKKDPAEDGVASTATTNSTGTVRRNAFMIDHLVGKDHRTDQKITHRTRFIPSPQSQEDVRYAGVERHLTRQPNENSLKSSMVSNPLI
jgi:hypothetical protein